MWLVLQARTIGYLTTYIVINRCYQYCSDHEEPVCDWNIKLAMEDCGSVDHFDLWEV